VPLLYYVFVYCINYVFVLIRLHIQLLIRTNLRRQTRTFDLILAINEALRPFAGAMVTFQLSRTGELATGYGTGCLQ